MQLKQTILLKLQKLQLQLQLQLQIQGWWVLGELAAPLHAAEHVDQPEGGSCVKGGESRHQEGGQGRLQPVPVLLQMGHPLLMYILQNAENV